MLSNGPVGVPGVRVADTDGDVTACTPAVSVGFADEPAQLIKLVAIVATASNRPMSISSPISTRLCRVVIAVQV
jgi:hypothetical protein